MAEPQPGSVITQSVSELKSRIDAAGETFNSLSHQGKSQEVDRFLGQFRWYDELNPSTKQSVIFQIVGPPAFQEAGGPAIQRTLDVVLPGVGAGIGAAPGVATGQPVVAAAGAGLLGAAGRALAQTFEPLLTGRTRPFRERAMEVAREGILGAVTEGALRVPEVALARRAGIQATAARQQRFFGPTRAERGLTPQQQAFVGSVEEARQLAREQGIGRAAIATPTPGQIATEEPTFLTMLEDSVESFAGARQVFAQNRAARTEALNLLNTQFVRQIEATGDPRVVSTAIVDMVTQRQAESRRVARGLYTMADRAAGNREVGTGEFVEFLMSEFGQGDRPDFNRIARFIETELGSGRDSIARGTPATLRDLLSRPARSAEEAFPIGKPIEISQPVGGVPSTRAGEVLAHNPNGTVSVQLEPGAAGNLQLPGETVTLPPEALIQAGAEAEVINDAPIGNLKLLQRLLNKFERRFRNSPDNAASARTAGFLSGRIGQVVDQAVNEVPEQARQLYNLADSFFGAKEQLFSNETIRKLVRKGKDPRQRELLLNELVQPNNAGVIEALYDATGSRVRSARAIGREGKEFFVSGKGFEHLQPEIERAFLTNVGRSTKQTRALAPRVLDVIKSHDSLKALAETDRLVVLDGRAMLQAVADYRVITGGDRVLIKIFGSSDRLARFERLANAMVINEVRAGGRGGMVFALARQTQAASSAAQATEQALLRGTSGRTNVLAFSRAMTQAVANGVIFITPGQFARFINDPRTFNRVLFGVTTQLPAGRRALTQVAQEAARSTSVQILRGEVQKRAAGE